jgi:hypothetical protein
LHEGYGTLYFPKTTATTTTTTTADVGSATNNDGQVSVWNPILYGDFKPENIFVHYPANPTSRLGVKIADFGCAAYYNRSLGHPEYETDYYAGTAEYAPPETPVFSAKADVWAAAACVHAACKGDIAVDLTQREKVVGWRDMDEGEVLRKCVRRAHDVSVRAVDRTPLHYSGLGHQRWQGAYSEGLQYVLSCGLAFDMNVRGVAVDMVNVIKEVNDSLQAQSASSVDWKYWMPF